MNKKEAGIWIRTVHSWLAGSIILRTVVLMTGHLRRCALGLVTCALVTFSPAVTTSSYAMDYEWLVYSFWSELIDSYWYPSHAAYLVYENEPDRLLPGESEPTGLIKNHHSLYPPSPAGALCKDFRLVRLSEIDALELKKPFRSKTKGTLYMELEGWLAGFFHPSRARFWIAAMLPKDAPPLFNDNGVGLNPKVMSGRMNSGYGWPPEGVQGLPADRLLLRSVTSCDGFDLYYVEYVG
jgi:hypothetical protein